MALESGELRTGHRRRRWRDADGRERQPIRERKPDGRPASRYIAKGPSPTPSVGEDRTLQCVGQTVRGVHPAGSMAPIGLSGSPSEFAAEARTRKAGPLCSHESHRLSQSRAKPFGCSSISSLLVKYRV